MSKNLILKASLLAFAIASLWALLWIYPRQQVGAISSSFTADSQKVVKSSQKPKIVFAGLSGDSPRYIDSGSDRGTGWIDVQTLGIQKGLRARGYEVENLWMTPARIEHEIQTGQPLCTYPVKWKDPSRLFAKKPDRLYSIALDFEEEEAQSLVIKKSKFEHIRRHLDAKGDLNVLSLVEDPSLKTLLIRDKDYGDLTWKLTTKDVSGDQIARTQYEKYIALRVVRDSRQLIEMLNADRFDYLLGNRLEDLDFEGTKIAQENYLEIKYSTTRGVSSLGDAQVVRASIACATHPSMFEVIPILNALIAKERGPAWKSRMVTYQRHFMSSQWNSPVLESFFLVGRFAGQLSDGSADAWYDLQKRHYPELGFISKSEGDSESLPPLPEGNRTPSWHAIETGDHQHLILSQSDAYHRFIRDSDFQERTSFNSNINTGWNHRLLERELPETLISLLGQTEWFEHSGGVKAESLAQLAQELPQRLSSPIGDLTLFAGGLTSLDALHLKPILNSPSLRAIRVIDATSDFLKTALPTLGNQLQAVELIRSAVNQGAELTLLELLGRLKVLRTVSLTSAALDSATLLRVVGLLPPALESLSLSSNPTAFSKEVVGALASKVWKDLRKIDLSGNHISTPELELILTALPPTLMTLASNSNGGTFPHSMSKLDAFFPHLNRIELSLMSYDVPSGQKFRFPAGTHELFLNQATFDSKQITLPERLEVLDISDSWVGVRGLSEALKKLSPVVKVLNLSKAKLQLSDLELLVSQSQIQSIDRLDLSYNDLDDRAVEILTRANFKIRSLNLSKNLIRNTGAQRIASRFLPSLSRLNLSENPISDLGVEALARRLPEGLVALDLASLLSFEVSSIAKSLPKSLRKLDLSFNHLSDGDLEFLLPRLPEALQDLDLSGSDLSAKGVWLLAKWIPKRLSVLTLSQVKFTASSVAVFASRMPPTLTELKVGPLALDLKAAETLAKRWPPQIRVLELSPVDWVGNPSEIEKGQERLLGSLPSSVQRLNLQTRLNPSAIAALGKKMPPNLRWLKLEGALGDEGVLALSETLPGTLETLRLDRNQLKDRGMIALSKHLPSPLASLSVAGNHFGSLGVKSLCSQKRTILSLNVTGNALDSAGIDAFNQNCLSFLKRLYIGNNPIGNPAMAKFLRKLNPYFSFINAPSVGLTSKGFEEVVRSLPFQIDGIEINGNDIGSKGYELLEIEGMKRNKEGRMFFILR